MKTNQKPYHIEAREMGVVDFNAIKGINYKRISAEKLRTIWDYRAAGLKIDDARDMVEAWNRESYHKYRREEKQVETRRAGRILCMAQGAARNLIAYREALKSAMALPYATLDWTCPRVLWEVGGRAIVTVRSEDVTWSDKCHWPTSKTVSYTSYLIRVGEPGTIALYNMGPYFGVRDLSEKSIGHDLRGNWQTRVVRELLNIDYEQAPEIFYKKVAVCPAFAEAVFASVFDGSEYKIGETRREKAMKNHNGGLYCYRTAEEAQEAPFPDGSVLIDAQKCILAVQVRGRKIRYDAGKYAVSEMTPLEVVAG